VLQVEFTSKALEDLARLDRQVAQWILKKIRWLSENLDQVNPEPLTGKLKGVYKLRVGDWRTLYTLEGKKLIVHAVRHRRKVYKDR